MENKSGIQFGERNQKMRNQRQKKQRRKRVKII